MTKPTLKEEFCVLHGWEKINGIKFDLTGLDDDWDYAYFSKEDFKNNKEKCIFWQLVDELENIYEDIDEVVDYIEDHMDISFEDYKKARRKNK